MVYDYDRTAADTRPTVTIECDVTGDGDKGVTKILQFLQWCGSIGASRGLDCEGKLVAGFDGDGADSIPEIRVDGKPVKLDKKTRDDFNKILR